MARASCKIKPNVDVKEIEHALSILGLVSPRAMESLAEDLAFEDKERTFLQQRYVDQLPINAISEKIFCSDRHVLRIRKRILMSLKRQVFS